jgi:hypothetical protein
MRALLQQQQLTSTVCLSVQQIIAATRWLFILWAINVQQQDHQLRLQLVPKTACAALPLLQLTQRCSSLFNRATASTGSHGGAARVVGVPYRELWAWQSTAGQLVLHVTQLADDETFLDSLDACAKDHVWDLLRDAAASELVMQLLLVHTAQLHQVHTAHVRHQGPHQQQQQQQQRDPAAGSSSSSSSNLLQQRSAQGAKQQHRADLLSIPAFHQHQDVLQLLPGGQAYLDAAAAALASKCRSRDDAPSVASRLKLCWWTYILTSSMCDSLKHSPAQPLPGQSFLVASSAAVRLVLELVLLAAADLQRQQQGQIPAEDQGEVYQKFHRARHEAAVLLLDSNKLLHLQIRASLHASGNSCLPPEVLQQAGLQLLQALAAPVQQLQLGMFSEEMAEVAMMPPADQLLALRAAATGLSVAHAGPGPTSNGERAVTTLVLL